MPLYKTKHSQAKEHYPNPRLESNRVLCKLVDQVVLNDSNRIRLNGMKSEMHQRAFLCTYVIAGNGHTDLDLYYDEFGTTFTRREVHFDNDHFFGN
jgi:hypothetical protein